MSSPVVAGHFPNGASNIFYERSGDQSGPSILCIHGLGGSTNVFQSVIPSLADCNIVRLDISGHGRSILHQGKTSISSYVDDCEAILSYLALTEVAVVGHSMGCLIALHLAERRPDLVTRLILFGPIKSPTESGKVALLQRASAVREAGMAAVVDNVVRSSLANATLTQRPEVAAFARELLSRQSPEGYALACEAIANSSNPCWGKITSQVVIVSGIEDKASTPAICEDIKAEIKHGEARIVSWNDVGHWHTLENPRGSALAIREALSIR